MNSSLGLYTQSMALLTDLYQLTMAYAYWKSGMADKEAVFHLFFRKNPFGGGFSIACGLAYAVDIIKGFHFSPEDTAYLGGLCGDDGKPLFDQDFMEHLGGLSLDCSIDAIPEGTVVFPHQPLIRVQGPIMQCQLLETPLLNTINFQTLIATKAARVCRAAQDDPVLEFGLRRAHGIDGGLAASRAAYIGGCACTSNVLAGKLFDIPVRGTHAHSWVMAFDNELAAFEAYAAALPNNCVFLVDTYDSLAGVRRAITVGEKLREQGRDLAGIRLDSGDLAYLSIEARKLLDEAGFHNAQIFASNDLDEHIITSLKNQGAKITVWGVGTKLSTAYDQPAMGGVYKLSTIRDAGGEWQHKTKVSEQAIKTTTPGIQQVRRFQDRGEFVADVIYDTLLGIPQSCTMVDPADMTRRRHIPQGMAHQDLLVPVFRKGECVAGQPSIHQIRDFAKEQLAQFHPGIKRFTNPHQYPVGLEQQLFERKMQLILQARGLNH